MPSKIKTCEDYRTAMIDAAAAAVQPSLELHSHLDACPSCRAAFTKEQELFTAIDTGLRASTNAGVPASLLPRVRVQLNEQTVPRHSWVRVGAALASAVVLVAVIVFARGLGSGPAGVDRDEKSLTQDVPMSAIRAAPPPTEAAGMTTKRQQSRPIERARFVQAEELIVLIPEGQKRAIDALLVSVRQGKAKENILLAEEAEDSLKEPAVAPLVISPIELKPLAEVSAESPEDGRTRR